MGHIDTYCVLCGGPTHSGAGYRGEGWDPTLLSEKDTEWLGHCRLLGSRSPEDSDDEDNDRKFISKRGDCSGAGFHPHDRSTAVGNRHGEKNYDQQGFEDPDPNDPLDNEYFINDDIQTVFHESCWMLLGRLLGYSSHRQINKSAMSFALSKRLPGQSCQWCTNHLPWGPLEHDQIWRYVPGQEYIGFEPKLDVTVDMASLPKGPPKPPLDLNEKVIRDPFSKLPFDVLFAMMPYLQDKSRFDLMYASHRVYTKMHSDAFWRWMIKTDTAPWYPEIRPLLPELGAPKFDLKRTYFYLDYILFNLDSANPFLGLANRTRIMNACLDLAALYVKIAGESSSNVDLFLEPAETPTLAQREEAAAKMQSSAYSDDVPLVHYPEPLDTRKETVQFLDMMQDINEPKSFRACFNTEGVLIGLGVEFARRSGRTFGTVDEQSYSFQLEPSEWIKALCLYMKEPEFTNGSLDNARTYIEGIKIIIGNRGYARSYGVCSDNAGVRGLLPASDHEIVGFTGSISSGGLITHLGLLQYNTKDPSERSTRDLSLNTPIWKNNHQIWGLSNFKMLPFPELPTPTPFPRTHLQHQPLIWSRDRHEQTGFVAIEATLTTDTPTPQILGLNVTNNASIDSIRSIGDPWRRVGYPSLYLGPLPDQYKNVSVRTEEFPIRGNRGERLEEIRFHRESGAFRVLTNQGRSWTWGGVGGGGDAGEQKEEVEEGWTVQKGEFVGLVCVFGKAVIETCAAPCLSDVTGLKWIGGWAVGWC